MTMTVGHANPRIQVKRTPVNIEALLCFVIPLLIPLQFDVGGRLISSEILVVFLLPLLLLLKGRLLTRAEPRRILLLGGLWLLGLVATDLIRGTKFADYSRGWALVGFTLIDFVCIYLLTEGREFRLKLLMLGYAIGVGAETLLNPIVAGIRWKMGGGDAVMLGVLALLALWSGSGMMTRRLGLYAEIVDTVLSVLFNARNLAGRAFMNAILLSLTRLTASARFRAIGMRNVIVALAVLALPVTYVALTAYAFLAQSGAMGAMAQATYRAQSNSAYGAFGVLLGGRPEIFISTQAIADSPIIGHGSWARDMNYYLKFRQLAALGFDVRESGVTDPDALVSTRGLEPEIPSHSILFGSWVWAGVLAAVFWVYVLFLTMRALGTAVLSVDPLAPLIVHASTLFLWDILFSPYGNDRRFEAAIFLTVSIAYIELRTRQRTAPAARGPIAPLERGRRTSPRPAVPPVA
jgi:hypothetical protein